MGSLDAFLIALAFRLLGTSVLAVRLTQVALFVGVLLSMYWLARELGGSETFRIRPFYLDGMVNSCRFFGEGLGFIERIDGFISAGAGEFYKKQPRCCRPRRKATALPGPGAALKASHGCLKASDLNFLKC